MKNKIICIILITSICFAFSSCTKVDNNSNQTTVDSNYSQSTEKENQQKSNLLEYNGKKVKDIILDLLDSKASIGTENAEDLLNIEALSNPVDAKLNMQIGEIIIVFTDDSEYEFGKVFIGANNNYYLQIEGKDTANIYELNDKISN